MRLWRRLTAAAPAWCDPSPPRNRAERRGGGPMLDRSMDVPEFGSHRWLPAEHHHLTRSVPVKR